MKGTHFLSTHMQMASDLMGPYLERPELHSTTCMLGVVTKCANWGRGGTTRKWTC